VASALVCAVAPAAAGGPSLRTSRGCYVVGQRATANGAGFAASREFDLTVDGVDLGQSTTDSSGAFQVQFRPAVSWGPGTVQHVYHLDATDGSSSSDTKFTLTRSTRGRFLAIRGNANSQKAAFQVMGFGLDGISRIVYLHYVSPSGRSRATVTLGHTGGQCGYLLTRPRRVFPFTPSAGTWTFQYDTHRGYSRRPGGPVSRVAVKVF
jgi:hypothetical protein